VGSGKTLVAFLALARALEEGQQGVFLAPTEILAHQHAQTLKHLLQGTPFQVTLLTRTTAKKKTVLEGIVKGEIHVVIGTHAVFQEAVVFHQLGLVVIDEQHRFGVAQRLQLMEKGTAPHMLVMSATPIPRTLEMTLFGDLDVSTLRDKPSGRQPIQTRVMATHRMPELEAFLQKQLEKGAQVYWVCPLIEPAETEEGQKGGEGHKAGGALPPLPTVLERFAHLETLFPGRVGLVHGQQKAAFKQEALDAFRAKKKAILVATTVIEVGVDVPDATVMVIEGAQQFGLAQLHQLRGRVGRGGAESFCFLVYGYPLSDVGKQRLEIMRTSQDGFFIAEKDWQLRGGGDLLGVRQSGVPLFSFADLEVHLPLLTQANGWAVRVLEEDPSLQSEKGMAWRLLLKLFQKPSGSPAMLKTV
jgi:ATP-dependent DNA helicase RecG